MTLLLVIYGSAAFLALAAVILGAVNLRTFLTTSSRISLLEDEVNKKASEFDALRNRHNSIPAGGHESLPDGYDEENRASEQEPDDHSEHFDASEGIQIVRNVRDPYANTNEERASGIPVTTPPVSAPIPQTSPEPALTAPPEMPPETGAHKVPLSPDPMPAAAASPVTQTPLPPRSTHSSKRDIITIPIFSEAKKDADFPYAWEALASQLQNARAPRVHIDFDRVLFLYEEELQYLEEMKRMIEAVSGSLKITNCDKELAPAILNHPTLANCLTRE